MKMCIFNWQLANENSSNRQKKTMLIHWIKKKLKKKNDRRSSAEKRNKLYITIAFFSWAPYQSIKWHKWTSCKLNGQTVTEKREREKNEKKTGFLSIEYCIGSSKIRTSVVDVFVVKQKANLRARNYVEQMWDWIFKSNQTNSYEISKT